MIISIGIDIIEVRRVRETIERTPRFAERVFTAAERAYCESRGAVAAQHYAARFAAQEATLKKFCKDDYRRLLSLDAFVTGGNLRFCAAWIANAGAAKATWDWDPDISPDTLGKKMTALPGRITSLTSYVLNGKRRYAAVWV